MSIDGQQTADLLQTGWIALQAGAWRDAYDAFAAAVAREETAEALEGLGFAAWWLDETAATFRAREAAFRRYREQGDRRGAARVATWLSMDYFTRRGEQAIARGWVQRAYRLLEGLGAGPEQAIVGCWDAHMAILVEHDVARARRLYAEAAALARSLGVGDLETLARAGEGFALVCAGEVGAGMRLLDETTAAVASGEMTDPDAMTLSCCYLIYACERVRDVDRAAQWCDQLFRLAERWSYHAMFSFCRTHYAGVLISRGDWPRAESELAAAAEELSETHPALAFEAIARLAELRRRQGRLDDAAALLARLDDHPLRMLGRTPVLLVRARVALDRGDPAAATSLAERYLRAVRSEDRLERVAALEVLVRCWAIVGDHAAAAEALAELGALTTEAATPALRAVTSFSAGVVAVAAGDYEAARRRFEDAADLYALSGAPYEVARSRLELASVLSGLGRTDAARAEAAAALAALERLGARQEAKRAEALARHLAQLRDDRSPGLPRLTPRELHVLRLAASGLSDKEMAQALGLSEHTVHRHVANVLTKLDLPSRAAAIALAARHGLL
jgi:DNA-binding NarL/FixJ family response regulator